MHLIRIFEKIDLYVYIMRQIAEMPSYYAMESTI